MARDWTGTVRYSWFKNDVWGCCTIAGLAHLAQCHASLHGEPHGIDDGDIEEAYRAVSGWDGKEWPTPGASMLNALVYARSIGIGPWKLGAFVKVNLDDVIEVRAAIALFGGIYVGADLPLRIEQQGAAWYLPELDKRTFEDKPRSLGGHAFAVTGYDRDKLHALPWIAPTTITNAWASLYIDEAWAIVADSWVRGDRPAPNGFDVAKLRADLTAIGAP